MHLNAIEKWIFSRKTIILNSNDITIFSRKRISVTLCPANNFSRFSSSLLVSCLKVCTTVMYRGYFPQRVDKVKRSLASETLAEYFLNADLWWNMKTRVRRSFSEKRDTNAWNFVFQLARRIRLLVCWRFYNVGIKENFLFFLIIAIIIGI